jgi:hypothetical protein
MLRGRRSSHGSGTSHLYLSSTDKCRVALPNVKLQGISPHGKRHQADQPRDIPTKFVPRCGFRRRTLTVKEDLLPQKKGKGVGIFPSTQGQLFQVHDQVSC